MRAENPYLPMLLGLSICLILAGSSKVSATDESPPQELSVMRDLIQNAISSNSQQVVIPPGVYRGGPLAGTGTCITLKNAKGLTVMAEGVRMICTNRARAFTFDHCDSVTLQGLTIDYDPLPFTQGTIVAVDPAGKWIDVKIHKGYAVEAWRRIDLIDPRTLHRKRGMPFLFNAKVEITGPDTVRVHQPDLGKCVALGDYVTLSGGSGPGAAGHGIALESCAKTILRNIALHSAPVFGIADHGGEGETHLVNCSIVPGPPPPGAVIPPLLSTTADAVNHNSCRKGPLVEGCTFAGAGDDTWSVSASDYVVLANDGSTLVLAARDQWLSRVEAGDRLQQSLDGPIFKVVSAHSHVPRTQASLSPEIVQKLSGPNTPDFWKLAHDCDVITLEGPAPWPPGTSVWSPDRACEGAIFRNNFVHSSGRILLRGGAGSHMLIEENTLIEPHAIVLCPELAPQSASGIEDVTIRNNTIIGSGYFDQAGWSSQAGAICMIAPLAQQQPIYRNIVISGNTLQDINGLGILVGEAEHVMVEKNVFLATHQQAPPPTGDSIHVDQHVAIFITKSSDVTLSNNTIENPGPFFTHPVGLGPMVTGVTGQDTGVTIAP